jgi:hypothetical protein
VVYTVSPLVKVFAMQYIVEELGLDPDFTPWVYKLARLFVIALEAAVVTPLEFARKRMFAQRIDSFRRQARKVEAEDEKIDSGNFDTCVETSPGAYTGMLNVIASVVSEEGGKAKQKIGKEWESVYGDVVQPRKQSTWGVGIMSVYRGYWTRVAAGVVEFCAEADKY